MSASVHHRLFFALLPPSGRARDIERLSSTLGWGRQVRTVRRPGWHFSPHLTLLYRRGLGFFQPIEPITWPATELVLVPNHVGLTRHDIPVRWPLAGGGALPAS